MDGRPPRQHPDRLSGLPVSSTPIAPALTPEEWASKPRLEKYVIVFTRTIGEPDPDILPTSAMLIAVANAALPDDDPRKITRAKLEALRSLAIMHETARGADVTDERRFIDALESYLPPAP